MYVYIHAMYACTLRSIISSLLNIVANLKTQLQCVQAIDVILHIVLFKHCSYMSNNVRLQQSQ